MARCARPETLFTRLYDHMMYTCPYHSLCEKLKTFAVLAYAMAMPNFCAAHLPAKRDIEMNFLILDMHV